MRLLEKVWNIFTPKKKVVKKEKISLGDVTLYNELGNEYEVALMWREQGQTQKATANLMGISQNRVKYLWRQAILRGECERRK